MFATILGLLLIGGGITFLVVGILCFVEDASPREVVALLRAGRTATASVSSTGK